MSDSCEPMDCGATGSSVHGISQAKLLEWLPFPSPRDLPNPGIKTTSPALADRFFTTESPGKPLYMHIVFYSLFWASLVYSTKESTCNVRENDNPLQDSYLENPHGQRSLVGYSPWGRRVRHDWATKHSTFIILILHDINNLLAIYLFCN